MRAGIFDDPNGIKPNVAAWTGAFAVWHAKQALNFIRAMHSASLAPCSNGPNWWISPLIALRMLCLAKSLVINK